MTNKPVVYTDPARVREVLAYHDQHGSTATMRDLGIASMTLRRWIAKRTEHGPGWPGADVDAAWQAGKERRDRHAAEERRRRIRKYVNGGRPLMLDSTGTRRRIQALARLGWTTQHIADLGPWQTGSAVGMLTRFPTVTEGNATHIARIYETLSMKVGPSDLTRRRAHRAGWPPPLAWDNIDTDPDPDPWRPEDTVDVVDEVVVLRLLAGQTVPSSKPERCEAMRRWLADGRSERSLCVTHGWKDGRYAPAREDGAA